VPRCRTYKRSADRDRAMRRNCWAATEQFECENRA
jgi:hypothetical protein